ncbi:autophagy protein atg9 [Castilleja foliolosa]|uniref:Autophagy-related protein 9 n=1 Tax=Castilleja foliolosa TaxID=1961234 RepID=A0ABD3DT16_9LAMI
MVWDEATNDKAKGKSTFEESLLEGHALQIFGRNLLWYAAVFGTITAISRAAMMDELLVFDPQGVMSLVVQRTHFMRKKMAQEREYCDCTARI